MPLRNAHFAHLAASASRCWPSDSFVEWNANILSDNPLNFEGQLSYTAKLEDNRKKTGLNEAIICGQVRVSVLTPPTVSWISILGGSMGRWSGKKSPA